MGTNQRKRASERKNTERNVFLVFSLARPQLPSAWNMLPSEKLVRTKLVIMLLYTREMECVNIGFSPNASQDGWMLAKFLFSVSVHTLKKEKKRMRPISSHLNRKSLVDIRLLLFGFRGNFSRGTRRLVPSGQESSILLTRVVNHGVRFGLSCLLTELAI